VNRNLHSAVCVGKSTTQDGGTPTGANQTLYGVLALTLHPGSVDYRYVRAASVSTAPAFGDEATSTIVCH
jgi:hypothetical protein